MEKLIACATIVNECHESHELVEIEVLPSSIGIVIPMSNGWKNGIGGVFVRGRWVGEVDSARGH